MPSKEYYLSHKKHFEDYRKNNREYQKECHKKYQRKIRLKILELLGGKCANPYNLPHPDWCNDSRCLQIDHVNGGGTKALKNPVKEYQKILLAIQSGSKDYQCLCANCNWLKRYENNECHS